MSVLAGHRFVPVCGLRSPEEAGALGTPDALECLAAMAAVPGLTVGAGTVRTAAQLDAVQAAGAPFAVSPCLTPALATAARSSQLRLIPGVATASEVQRALEDGFTLPTGGITSASANSYLAHPQIEAVGGSWMLPRAARGAGDWDLVTQAVVACVTEGATR